LNVSKSCNKSCCNPFLGPHTKGENTKKFKKIYSKENQKNNNSEKRIPEHLENDHKLVEEVQKYKDWNLTIYFLLMRALLIKKKFNLKKKSLKSNVYGLN